MQPALFLPHGAPDLALSDIPASRFLRDLFNDRPSPRGIVIISAHWETSNLQMTTSPQLSTVHDFGGFGGALHALRYPADSAPWLVELTQNALSAAGFAVGENATRGLDHGAWIPLMLAFPAADIPVVQLSLPRRSPRDLFAIGRALAILSSQNVLVIGSGATVHNLRHIAPEGHAAPEWATGFDDWLSAVLETQDWNALIDFHATEFGRVAHPTMEHLLPLIIIAGLCDARSDATMRCLHRSYSYGSIGMAAWEVAYAT